MTTNFTLRDFFVYLIAGFTLIISIGIIFFDNIFKFTIVFFEKYEFIKDFAFLATIFLIPTIYLLGHIIGALGYNLLKMFIWIDKKFKKPDKKMPRWKFILLIKLQQLLYRQRVAYAIIKYTKSKSKGKPFKNITEFWMACAKLQIEKIYAPAEYWYVLNELFNSINLIFFIATIISFIVGHWLLGIVYLILTIFSFKRAKQYAAHFVQTVYNLTIARKTTPPMK